MEDHLSTTPPISASSVERSASKSTDESPGLVCGQRVHALGDTRRIGTVRYVGALEGYPGTWIGVDWDNEEGKHDGCVNGVKYFVASGERSGSFVRPKNVSAGINFLEALELRYHGDYTKEEEDEMYVYSTRKNRVVIQLVGKEKIQEKLNDFQELSSVSVSYMGVSSIGSLSDIYATVPNLKELNIAGNLLSNWQDVQVICDTLPSLEILDLTGSRIEVGSLQRLSSLKNIRILVLNNCGITWKEVEVLEKSLPVVQELHLVANKLKKIMDVSSNSTANFVTGFDCLNLLNLEDNLIDSWDEIIKLSQLKRLEHLYLNKNKLKHILYPCCSQDAPIRPFENLRCLLVGRNEIEDLASINSLNSFPSLMDVRVAENPICDLSKGGLPRFVQIASLPKVDVLNGSEVSKRERRDSEIRYIRFVLSRLHLCHQEEIKTLYPRFSELKQYHGLDYEKPSSVGVTDPQKMSSGLLSITLKCVGASMGEKLPLTKKLPPSTTIGKLKALCGSLFKLNDIKPALYIQEEGSPFPSLLDDDMSSLVDLGIGTDTVILVDEEASC